MTALCPGDDPDRFHAVAGMAPGRERPSRAVGRGGRRGRPPALERGKAIVVPNLFDSAWILTGRFVPRTLPPRIGAAVFSRLKRAKPV